MIPLLRPIAPSSKAAERYFRESRKRSTFANFGPMHEALARELRDTTTAEYALPIVSGTAAIEIALRVCGVAPGGRVMLPDFTHTGTLLAVVRAGMTPVLAGVDPKTWTLRLDEADDAFTKGKIDAVIVVSPFGYHVPVEDWEMLSLSHGLPLVYDMAGAFGQFPYRSMRNPLCYSFHATKNFGVGEGGMITFDDKGQYDRARRLINFDTQADRTIASLDGANYKMCELVSSYLLASLDQPHIGRVLARIEAKRQLLRFYQEMLPFTSLPAGAKSPSLCVLGQLPAQDLEAASEELGVTFKRYYPLLSRMSALAEVGRLSESDSIMETCVALPCDVDMREAFTVVDAVRSLL